MVHKKTRLVHSLALKNFLIECGLEPIEEIENPFRENFFSWRFADTKQLNKLINIYMSERIDFKELCNFMLIEIQDERLYFLKDLAPKLPMEDCVYLIDKDNRTVYKIKK